MRLDFSNDFLLGLLEKQLSFFAVSPTEMSLISGVLSETLKRTEYCFFHNSNKYYKKDGEAFFNPFHSAQWTIFLYYLANTVYKRHPEESVLCDKIYYLNRTLNGCDLFYEVSLPDIFMLDHPLGSIMGRAEYSDYFSFSQGCTVGNNKGVYPKFGKHVTMLSNSKVIGASLIGNYVVIAANAFVKDETIGSHTIVFGSSPNLIFKVNKQS